MNNIKLTIFTPAYNRAYTLVRTYESLCAQTCKDFIWLIVDDGSKDNTSSLVKEWQNNINEFEIKYIYKENGGMHTAHNVAYANINTELNVCIDSDDAMPPDGVESILRFWNEHGSNEVAGIIALDSDMNGKVIGSELPQNLKIATTEDIYEIYHVWGDKKYIYRTDIINSVEPYPEFKNEKLVPLSYKYLLIAQNWSMLLMNHIVCLVDYQVNGSSNTIVKQYMQSPRGFAAEKRLRMIYTKSFKRKIQCIIHYIAECRIAKDRECIKKSPAKILTILLYPVGILAEIIIEFKNNLLLKR